MECRDMRDIGNEEWFRLFKARYARSSKRGKKMMLNELVDVVGVHRKSAIRLLKRGRPASTSAHAKAWPRPSSRCCHSSRNSNAKNEQNTCPRIVSSHQ